MAVLIASGLRKELSGDPLFDGVSFRVRRGDRLALAALQGGLADERAKQGGLARRAVRG